MAVAAGRNARDAFASGVGRLAADRGRSAEARAALNAAHVFGVFLRLGLTSFGGPTAHLGFFHDEFVTRRRWLDEAAYADLVALCQFLPGPASSQAGIALGYLRAGYPGAAMAWLGFTAPSAVIMVLLRVRSRVRMERGGGMAARPQARRGRGRRPGGVDDGAEPLDGSAPHRDRTGRGHPSPAASAPRDADSGHRGRRAGRSLAA